MTKPKRRTNARQVARAIPTVILALAVGETAMPMAFATDTDTATETITHTQVTPTKLDIAYEGEKLTYVANVFVIEQDCELEQVQAKTSAEDATAKVYLVKLDETELPSTIDPQALQRNLLDTTSGKPTTTLQLKKGDRLLAMADVTRTQKDAPEQTSYLVELPRRDQAQAADAEALISRDESLVWQDGTWNDITDWLATNDIRSNLAQQGISDTSTLDNPAIDLIVKKTTQAQDEEETQSLKVTFDKNAEDARGEMEPQEVKPSDPAALNVCTFVRNDYKFKGWNTQADGSGDTYVDQGTIETTADVTLYAQWEKEQTESVTTTNTTNGNVTNNNSSSSNSSNSNSSNSNRPSTSGTSNNNTSNTSTQKPTMSNDKSGQFVSRSQTITYTIKQTIPTDVTSITITHNLDNAMEYVDPDENVEATCTGEWNVTDTRIEGQKLTVQCERYGTASSSQTAQVTFKAKVKDSADLTSYLESSTSSNKIAKVPYQCTTQFVGNSTRSAQSEKEYVKFSLADNDVKGTTTSSTTSNKSNKTNNAKNDGSTLATTADPTSVTGMMAILTTGLASLAVGMRRMRKTK